MLSLREVGRNFNLVELAQVDVVQVRLDRPSGVLSFPDFLGRSFSFRTVVDLEDIRWRKYLWSKSGNWN